MVLRLTGAPAGGAPAAHAATHNLGGTDVLTFPNRLLASSYPAISPGVVNTTTKTDLFAITVPAASLAAGDLLTAEFSWDLLNNTGSSVNYTFEYRLGSTVVFTSGALSITANASRYHGTARVQIGVAVIANDHRWTINQLSSNTAAGAVLVTATSAAFNGQVTAESLTTDKTLGLAVTMGTANALADCRPIMGTLTRNR